MKNTHLEKLHLNTSNTVNLRPLKISLKSVSPFNFEDFRRVVIPNQHGKSIVCFEDIIYAESSSNYCTIFLRDGKMLVSKTLKWLEERLDNTFLRVHRSYVVSLLEISHFDARHNTLELKNSQHIPISRRYRKEILKILT